tara:strand:- start:8339 stop:10564 length:2226 start_codon:yes stop_codon:yes gene_type:complete
METEITTVDVTATLRPTRIAFLIDIRSPLSWIMDEVLPWISTVWGGSNYFFLPIGENEQNNPDIQVWIKLLQKYDPDRIVSTASFSESFLEFLSESLLTRAEIFQFDSEVVQIPKMVHRGHHYTMPFEDLFSGELQMTTMVEYGPTESIVHDLWFFSHFGRSGKYQKDVCVNANLVHFNNLNITIQDIENNCVDIASCRYPNNFDGSPMKETNRFLGAAGVNGPVIPYLIPYIVIVGDKIEDWCLFQTLQNFYFSVRWIPTSLLIPKQESIPSEFDFLLYRMVTDQDREKGCVFTSASLSEADLNKFVSDSISRTESKISGSSFMRPRYSFDVDFNSIVKNWLEWGEPNNFSEIAMLFKGTSSIQKAPLLSPKGFKLETSKAKFQIDLHTSAYKFLGHNMIDSVPIRWPNERIALDDDARRSYTGGVSFNPIMHLSRAGQQIESALHGPRLVKNKFFQDLKEILSKKNLSPRKSIGSMNIDAVLNLWSGSVDLFYEEYYNSDSCNVFEVFRNGSKAKNKTSLGLALHAGIVIKNRFLFSMPIAEAFGVPLSSVTIDLLNQWIEREVLIRGEKLICQTCGWVDFYSEGSVSRKFKCNRCSNMHTRNILSSGDIDPRFLYDQNPLVYGLQESNSDLVLYGAKKIKDTSKNYFEFECEVEICNENQNAVQEIDIIGNFDGKLLVAECKTNGTLKNPQLARYVKFCRDFNVGHFVCISSTGWSNQTKANIESAFSGLKYIRILFI